MNRTHAEARAGIPMNAEQVSEVIRQMEAETKSRPARKRMAEVAIRLANVTTEGREAWIRYLATFDH